MTSSPLIKQVDGIFVFSKNSLTSFLAPNLRAKISAITTGFLEF